MTALEIPAKLDVSLAEVFGQVRVNTPNQITFEYATLRAAGGGYTEFVCLIERAFDFACQEMAKAKNILKGMNEDQLTYVILSTLRGMGFDAHHAMNVGGHCDVTIEGDNDTLWLGEAKIYSSAAKLFGGLRQLVDRYSTGLPGQDSGGMIVYVTIPNALRVMHTWRKKLLRAAPTVVSDDMPETALTFRTKITHAGSGLPLDIRHFPVILFHSPTDTLKTPNMQKGETGKLGLT
jgi:hypothetical protein